ncbi:hypothetical protein FRB97_001647, partial [Tulasnella sp. 331]
LPYVRYAAANHPNVANYSVPPTVVYVEPPPCVTHILVCIKSTFGAENYNRAADSDIQLWFQATRQTLGNPRNRLYLVTDCTNFVLQDAVTVIYPTRSNVERIIRNVATTLRDRDECTLWFSCTGQNHVQALRLVNPLDTITGPQLYSWLTENTNPNALIRVGLDSCHTGRFLGLPWYFTPQGQLVAEVQPPGIIGWIPRIICISACRSDQFAHHVESINDPEKQWGGLLWFLVWAHLDGVPRIDCVRDTEAILSPRLSDPVNGVWVQNPQVSMSFHDPNALFRSWF